MQKTVVYLIMMGLLCGSLIACGKIKGEFALRKPNEESYRKIEGAIEISVDESTDWAYVIPKIKGSHTISIALLKKELVWVEINVRNETLNEINKIIYGKIENLEKGDYKISLAENGEKIGEMEFVVYDDSGETEFDESE